MKNWLIRIFLTIVIPLITVAEVVGTEPVSAAAASTSVQIVKYAADKTTILASTTVNIATMESTLPVQGNGVTHYYTQGPTFDPANLWDPEEICPNDSLKDKGALKGTDVKDLCGLVGGASANDTIKIEASDGYGDTFEYANVYNPVPRQGPMVICWWKDGQYSGTWSDGMLLAFFTSVASTNAATAGKMIFGHQDMHDCLPELNWHWYYDGPIQYPSTHGLYVKWISKISIYTSGTPGWEVSLYGARNDVLTQSWFENGLACHGSATYTDNAGNAWSGMPLWYICSLVDDDNIHGSGSFNGTLYYDVKVSAIDGYSYTFPSITTSYNNTFILANKMNGTSLPADKYPLKLVSPSFTAGGPSVAQIARIDLLNISTTPPGTPTPTPTPGAANWPLQLIGAQSYNMTKTTFEGGAACHPVSFVEGDSTWSGIALWRIVGWVDDANEHGSESFNDTLVASNYRIKVTAADGYYQIFDAATVAHNDNIIIANKLNGAELPANTGDPPTHPAYPLKVSGSGTSSGSRVGGIVKIELVDLPGSQPPIWDPNGDHICNVGDVVFIGLQWRQTGAPGWIAQDVNHDGVINISDVVVLGLHWGQTW
jgi:DMSO/TMAO reductase YedYZ molybdopterin-dependent catalytic subunit